VAGKNSLWRDLVGVQLQLVIAHDRVPWTPFLGFLLLKNHQFDVKIVLNFRSVAGIKAGGEEVGRWSVRLCCGGFW
jgi:hypothetical protein